MALATPADREFRIIRAGFIRDSVVLANFRQGLRKLVNPETGQLFTEEEIARATQSPSRWFNEAQAIDDYGQGEQRNALYLADQVLLERATGKWLLDFHGRPWQVSHLAATGGSGEVTVSGGAGTIVLGSTTLPSPAGYQARDPQGNLFQVFATEVIPETLSAVVTMAAVSTGSATNLKAGTVLTWTTRDPNMQPTATVASDFQGGTDRETDAELARRIDHLMHYRPGAGNDSQFRAWARECSNAVLDGFVYPCALHAGSVLVAIAQKRGTAKGPLGRMPSALTLATAIAYLTPPTSPVVPPRPYVIVTPWVSQPADLVLRLGMLRASAGGWSDAQPFPAFAETTPQIVNLTAQSQFVIWCEGDATLPGQAELATLAGAAAPKMMIWSAALSAWSELSVQTITHLGGASYQVVLNTPPPFTVAVGDFVSPATRLAPIIAKALEDYFDRLGPGDLFDLVTDARGGRCVRFPASTDEWPMRAGATVATDVLAALGTAASDGAVESITNSDPDVQPSPQLGPKMVTLGKAAIYEV